MLAVPVFAHERHGGQPWRDRGIPRPPRRRAGDLGRGITAATGWIAGHLPVYADLDPAAAASQHPAPIGIPLTRLPHFSPLTH